MDKRIVEEITKAIDVVVEDKVSKLQFDTTKRGKVISILGTSATVEIDGINYNCKIRNGIKFNVGDTVLVNIANNNFFDKYIDGKLGVIGDDSGNMLQHGNEWHNVEFETVEGSIEKANEAEQNAKDYVDVQVEGIKTIDYYTTQQTNKDMITLNGQSFMKSPIRIKVEGRTISNLVMNGNFKNGTNSWLILGGGTGGVSNGEYLFTPTGQFGSIVNYIYPDNFTQFRGKKIFFRARVKVNKLSVFLYLNDGTDQVGIQHSGSGTYETLFGFMDISPSATTLYIKIQDNSSSGFQEIRIRDVMAIDISQNQELLSLTAAEINDSVPYYVDNTQSCEGLLVKSIGKNLFNKARGTFNEFNNGYFVSDYIKIDPNKQYKLSNNNWRIFIYYDSNYSHISTSYDNNPILTPPGNATYIRIEVPIDNLDIVQLEEGTVATTYEPYKESNTHINEFLGSLPNGVKNNIDGNLFTKRVEKVVLDGSLNWEFISSATGYKSVRYLQSDLKPFVNNSGIMIKYNGKMLRLRTGLGDDVIVNADEYSLGTTYSTALNIVSISNTDSGWGNGYNPTSNEIKAYINGWQMGYYNGLTFVLGYTTGEKFWRPIYDTHGTDRIISTLPTTESTYARILGWKPNELHYQLDTLQIKELKLSPVVADKHLAVEGWSRYVLKAEDITGLDIGTNRNRVFTKTPIFTNTFFTSFIDEIKIYDFEQDIPRDLAQSDSKTFIGKFFTLDGRIFFYLNKITATLAEAIKLLEGTVIYYKLAPQFHVNPSWSTELPTTLLTQANENSKAVGDLSKVVLENADLLKSQGVRLDSVGQIVESGSNANGNYVRFADGTQICSGSYSSSIANDDTYTRGGLTLYRQDKSWTFPSLFISTPAVMCSAQQNIFSEGLMFNISPLSSSSCVIRIISMSSFASYANLSTHVLAIGRWK